MEMKSEKEKKVVKSFQQGGSTQRSSKREKKARNKTNGSKK